MFLVRNSQVEGSFEAVLPAPSYLPPKNRPTATASSLEEIGVVAVMAIFLALAARETSSGWVADRELAGKQGHELRGNGEFETLALAETGRLVLKQTGRHRPRLRVRRRCRGAHTHGEGQPLRQGGDQGVTGTRCQTFRRQVHGLSAADDPASPGFFRHSSALSFLPQAS